MSADPKKYVLWLVLMLLAELIRRYTYGDRPIQGLFGWYVGALTTLATGALAGVWGR